MIIQSLLILYFGDNWQDPLVLALCDQIWKLADDNLVNGHELLNYDGQHVISLFENSVDFAIISWYKNRDTTEDFLGWDMDNLRLNQFMNIWQYVYIASRDADKLTPKFREITNLDDEIRILTGFW